MEIVQSWILEFGQWLWSWFIGLGYWVVCLSCIVSMALYAVSKNKKYVQYIGVAFTLWIFLKGFDSIL